MELYHVGFEIIKKPKINVGRKNADFGIGFYLSDDKNFSMCWARKRYNQKTYIIVYELDTTDLKIKKFRKDKYWFRYIYLNRQGFKDRYKDYDVMIGPIANDTIFETYGVITSGVFSDEQSLELMKIGNRYNQVVIKSEKALNNLKFVEAKQIKDEEIDKYRKTVAEEEIEYQSKLAQKIEEF